MASIKLKGDTSGEVTISSPAVAGTTTLELPATSSTLATENALGVRNLVINGDMRIDQRNGGTQRGVAQGYSFLDRFKSRSDATITTSNVNAEQSTDVPSGQGFIKSLKLSVATADTSLATDARYGIEHRIEGQNITHLDFGTSNAKTITLSFWVKSNLTGTYSLVFGAKTGTFYLTSYDIDSADTWEKKTITIDGATTGTWLTNNDIGLQIYWNLVGGTNYQTTAHTWGGGSTFNILSSGITNWINSTSNNFYITGVQLEVGDTATPFEHRPYDMELARCQRYYIRHGNPFTTPNTGRRIGLFHALSTVVAVGFVPIPTNLRAVPTINFTDLQLNDDIVNATISSFGTIYTSGGQVSASINSTGLTQRIPSSLRFTSTSGFIDFNAEL